MAIYCHKCGHEMQPGDMYCPSCKAMSNQELTPERIEEIQSNYKTNKKGCAGFLGIIVLIAAVIGVSFIFGGSDGASSMVFILIFGVINVILFRLNKKERTLKTRYYNLTLKENLEDVDEKCPKCSAVISDNQPFCTSCGEKLSYVPTHKQMNTRATPAPETTSNFCSECGDPLSPGDKFCGSCGTKVSGKEVN